jgi:hypothetical protein
MPTILKTKNSVTTTVVPTTLQQGELAVNITDKKLWVGNAATTPVQLLGAGVTGDVVGPASATDNAISRFDATTGKLIQNSLVTVSDTGAISAPVDASISGLTVGKGAGAVSTNTAVGVSALESNSTGSDNTAVGRRAYRYGTASNNTALGSSALGNGVVTGVENTALGRASLFSHTTGNYNTATGSLALFANTTGSSNTAIGEEALQANTTASNNTAVGYQAGYTGTTGTGSVYLGQGAGYFATSSYNTMVGREAGYNVSSGGYNTFLGQSAGYYVTTGAKNTVIGQYNGNQGSLDIRTASNYIVLSDGDGNPNLWLDSNKDLFVPKVYVSTTASAANVFVTSGGQIIRSTSALKYKQDVRDLETIDINKFRAVRYKSKSSNDDQTKDHFGIIADEVDQAGITELVNYGANGEVEGFQYERLTVVLLKAVQELKAEIDSLKAQLNNGV